MVCNFVEFPHIVTLILNNAQGGIIMSNEEEMVEQLIERANKWIENPPEASTSDDIDDVERYMGRLQQNGYNKRNADVLHSLIKGHKNIVTLNAEEMKHVVNIVENLEQVFGELPNLSIPREKNRENLEKSVIKAVKAQKGENNA
tara:strand:- start:11 stop:445 length:435 start_codon:yes stop_codon:yes gene_type:complete